MPTSIITPGRAALKRIKRLEEARNREGVVKAAVRRVSALGVVAFLITLLVSSCGSMSDSAVQPTAGQVSATRSSTPAHCIDSLKARTEGNVVIATVECDRRPVVGAKLWLNSSLTRIGPEEEKFKQLFAKAHDDPDLENEALGQIKGVTNENGEARFDLSNVQAVASFSVDRAFERATIVTFGDFESGPPATCCGQKSIFVELKSFPLYTTWIAQAESKRGGTVEGARQITREIAASAKPEKADQIQAIAEQYCVEQGTTNDGEICFNVGVYLSKTLATAMARQQQSARYFERSCRAGYQAACSRPEIAAEKADLAQAEKQLKADSSNLHAQQEDPSERTQVAACKGGNKLSCGVAQSFQQCRQGDARQCAMIGVMFHEGQGLPRDLTKAQDYLNRGCDGGAQEGCRAIKEWKMRRQPSTASNGQTPAPPREADSSQPQSGKNQTGPAAPKQGGPVQHCVPNPDNNCSNKTFYCDVTKETLEHPPTDTGDGHGGRVCCWSHYHP